MTAEAGPPTLVLMWVAKLLFGMLFFFSQLALALPEEKTLTTLVEGSGTIRAGDTVRARSEAVEALMKEAMRTVVAQEVAANLFAEYSALLERHFVDHYGRFVKRYSVLSEVGERDQYRVRARVEVDGASVRQALKSHGLSSSTVAKPRVLLFIGDVSMDGTFEVESLWWQDMAARGAYKSAYAQDLLAARMRSLPLTVLSRSTITRAIINQRQANNRYSSEELLILAAALECDYLVFGKIWQQLSRVQLTVVAVGERRSVGKLQLSEKFFMDNKLATQPQRQDAVVYHLTGLILGDLLSKTEKDTSILVHFYGVPNLTVYQELLLAMQNIPAFAAVQEQAFSPRRVTLRLQSSLSAAEVMRLLQQKKFFRSKASFALLDDHNVEAKLQ